MSDTAIAASVSAYLAIGFAICVFDLYRADDSDEEIERQIKSEWGIAVLIIVGWAPISVIAGMAWVGLHAARSPMRLALWLRRRWRPEPPA